jgi:hypothetical protein
MSRSDFTPQYETNQRTALVDHRPYLSWYYHQLSGAEFTRGLGAGAPKETAILNSRVFVHSRRLPDWLHRHAVGLRLHP